MGHSLKKCENLGTYKYCVHEEQYPYVVSTPIQLHSNRIFTIWLYVKQNVWVYIWLVVQGIRLNWISVVYVSEEIVL